MERQHCLKIQELNALAGQKGSKNSQEIMKDPQNSSGQCPGHHHQTAIDKKWFVWQSAERLTLLPIKKNKGKQIIKQTVWFIILSPSIYFISQPGSFKFKAYTQLFLLLVVPVTALVSMSFCLEG